jgi:hypothetical protein
MGFGQEYQRQGIKEFYNSIGMNYNNPHNEDIIKLIKSVYDPNLRYLDLASGDGIISQTLIDLGCCRIEGCEPYLNEAYINKTKLNCLNYSFEDIANGKLKKTYDVIICSYAMHLVSISYLPNLLYQLSLISEKLIILTPHKRPEINHFWKLSSFQNSGKTKMKIYLRII